MFLVFTEGKINCPKDLEEKFFAAIKQRERAFRVANSISGWFCEMPPATEYGNISISVRDASGSQISVGHGNAQINIGGVSCGGKMNISGNVAGRDMYIKNTSGILHGYWVLKAIPEGGIEDALPTLFVEEFANRQRAFKAAKKVGGFVMYINLNDDLVAQEEASKTI